MKYLNTGARMGLCLFLGQTISLKIIDELGKSGHLDKGWTMVLTTTVLLIGWQVVQAAYSRGQSDAARAAKSDANTTE